MRRLIVGVFLASAGCAAQGHAPAPTTKPVMTMPVRGLGGAKVPVFPVITFSVAPATGWDAVLTPKRDALNRIDSIIAATATDHAPEVEWVNAMAVRKAATQAPGMLANPDQLSTAQLKTHALSTVPEPLRAQLRNLTAVATGGRYALIPAGLSFVHDAAAGRSFADLSVALVDVRIGAVSWSATLHGVGNTPWEAVAVATGLVFPQ